MKREEHRSMRIYNLLRISVKIFRFTELFLALIFLFWTFSRLPLVIRISSDYVNQISGFFASPIFGFVLCNSIVVTLIANPRSFSGYDQISQNVETELYNELIKSGTGDGDSLPLSGKDSIGIGLLCADSEPVEVEYEDKEVISEERTAAALFTGKMDRCTDAESDLLSPIRFERMNWNNFGGEKPRRIEKTEKETIWRENVCHQNEMSNGEFQRRIEAFISRELRFRREESVTVVQTELPLM